MPRARVFFETSLICGSFYGLNSQDFADLACAHSASQTVPTLLQSLQREHDKSVFRNIGLDSELQEAPQFEFQSNISAIAKPFHDPQNGSSDLSLTLPSNESATSFTGIGIRTVANVTKPKKHKKHIRRRTKRKGRLKKHLGRLVYGIISAREQQKKKQRQKKHSGATSKLSKEAENEDPQKGSSDLSFASPSNKSATTFENMKVASPSNKSSTTFENMKVDIYLPVEGTTLRDAQKVAQAVRRAARQALPGIIREVDVDLELNEKEDEFE